MRKVRPIQPYLFENLLISSLLYAMTAAQQKLSSFHLNDWSFLVEVFFVAAKYNLNEHTRSRFRDNKVNLISKCNKTTNRFWRLPMIILIVWQKAKWISAREKDRTRDRWMEGKEGESECVREVQRARERAKNERK